ncbi:MAG: hypothetical protein S4CHLAM37_01180 [Chlamydiia bacterium]|nr:hypothetical protein [Chlamydiia bacterium]
MATPLQKDIAPVDRLQESIRTGNFYGFGAHLEEDCKVSYDVSSAYNPKSPVQNFIHISLGTSRDSSYAMETLAEVFSKRGFTFDDSYELRSKNVIVLNYSTSKFINTDPAIPSLVGHMLSYHVRLAMTINEQFRVTDLEVEKQTVDYNRMEYVNISRLRELRYQGRA